MKQDRVKKAAKAKPLGKKTPHSSLYGILKGGPDLTFEEIKAFYIQPKNGLLSE